MTLPLRQLLDVDVDQLARPAAFIAARSLLGGATTAVEPSKALGAWHGLDRRRGEAVLVGAVIGSPTVPLAELDDPSPITVSGAVR